MMVEKVNECGDMISRQATLDEIIKELGIKDESYLLQAERKIYYTVKYMPSVKPHVSDTNAGKIGKWLPTGYDGYFDGEPIIEWWQCSECGYEHHGDYRELPNFCPNCGAKNE